MKVAIVIPCFNRFEYVKECLDSLKRSEIRKGTKIIIVDDASTDQNVKSLISSFDKADCEIITIFRQINGGVKQALLEGIVYAMYCDLIINLDSDAIVSNDFVQRIVELKNIHPHRIVTGFNCDTLNRDGSVRHQIIEDNYSCSDGNFYHYNIKQTVGGINLAYTPKEYLEYVQPALKTSGNWDQRACLNIGNGIACVCPSVVNHIGLVSSMGHTFYELPDTADDFKPLNLPNVTLICVDCVEPIKAIRAIEISMEQVRFGAVKMLSHHTNIFTEKIGFKHIQIPIIRSKQEYSSFIMKEIYKYVDTDYMLIIQNDGYVVDYKAWQRDFLEYDYIGASWWYADGLNNGNGGFSLRSKKIMQIAANDPEIIELHPEDDRLGRKYRPYLEKNHGIKFAPISLCEKFSIENWNRSNKTWNGQFGFHGKHIIIPNNKRIV